MGASLPPHLAAQAVAQLPPGAAQVPGMRSHRGAGAGGTPVAWASPMLHTSDDDSVVKTPALQCAEGGDDEEQPFTD